MELLLVFSKFFLESSVLINYSIDAYLLFLEYTFIDMHFSLEFADDQVLVIYLFG